MARFLRAQPAPPQVLTGKFLSPLRTGQFGVFVNSAHRFQKARPPFHDVIHLRQPSVFTAAPAISYETPVTLTVGVPTTLMPTVHGYVPTGGFAVSAGALPGGLSISADTGVISGTPTTSEVQTPTVTATNSYGTGSKQITITVTGGGGSPSATASSAFSESFFTPFFPQSAFG